MTAVAVDQDNDIGIVVLEFSARESCTPLCAGLEVPSNTRLWSSHILSRLSAVPHAAAVPVSTWWHRSSRGQPPSVWFGGRRSLVVSGSGSGG